MNKTITSVRYSFLLVCIFIMGSLNALAQDNTTESHSVTTTTSTTTAPANNMDWMNNPWVWAGAGVVVLLLLIAVFSGKSKDRSKSEVIKTTTYTTEVKND